MLITTLSTTLSTETVEGLQPAVIQRPGVAHTTTSCEVRAAFFKAPVRAYGIISGKTRNVGGMLTMTEELKTAANWAKELGFPEKKLKDGMKAAQIQPDAKKGCCSYPGFRS